MTLTLAITSYLLLFGLFVGEFVNWMNKRLSEEKRVFSKDFFKKYFDTPEKESAKYEENLESLQRKAEEKGLYEAPDEDNELEL